jgi:hypothetical protein
MTGDATKTSPDRAASGFDAPTQIFPTPQAVGLVAAGAALAGLAAFWPLATVAATAATAVVVLVASRPAWAAYTYVGVAPLTVGLDRGLVLPLLRPQELLLALLWIGLLAGPVRSWVVRGMPRVPVSPVDVLVLLLAVNGSVTTLLWMTGRGAEITGDDILFALTLWKYLAVYVLFRIAVRADAQVRRVLVTVLAATSVVAVIGILQALGAVDVSGPLSAFAPGADEEALAANRASSTIGTPIGFADTVVIALAASIGWFTMVGTATRLIMAAGVLFAVAALASGQASGVIGLLVGVVATGWAIGRLRSTAVWLLPGLVLAGLAVAGPVLGECLQNLDPATGLPVSWTGDYGRLANLQTYIWPRLAEPGNAFFGVRPSSRVAAPEPWREWVWIESGYTWLLWNGGVLLLAAFVAYLVVAGRTTLAVLRARPAPAVSAAALAAFAGLAMVAVLMLLDPHLTIRGSADLLFPLVALSVTGASFLSPSRGASS